VARVHISIEVRKSRREERPICGSGTQKRKWVIEMNDARQLYLATYGRIDTIDNLINKCNMYYCSWKYWHSAKNHGLALAVVTAYGMYKECVQETLARAAFGIDPDEDKA
jgi:hypothetical protein